MPIIEIADLAKGNLVNISRHTRGAPMERNVAAPGKKWPATALVLLTGLATAVLAATPNPLLGTWRSFDRTDPKHVIQQTVSYRADGTFENEMIVANDGTGQYFYTRGHYRLTGARSAEIVVDMAGICVAGQGLSSCLPNSAATLGVPVDVPFQVDGADQLSSGPLVYHRLQ